MGIHELDKAPGQRCVHVAAGKGCGIYETRPQTCRVFLCQWLMNEDWPHRLRPDITKTIITSDEHGLSMLALCDPANPLAWRREPTYSLLKSTARARWGSGFNVMARAGGRLWVIMPQEDRDLGEVADTTAVSVLQLPGGAADIRLRPAEV